MISATLPEDRSTPDLRRPLPVATAGEGLDTKAEKRQHILVVDDEVLIANTLVHILNRNGYIARAAYDGLQAVELARHFCPDVVLSDVLMPKLDGVEAAIQLRDACPTTRIVLFSGQAATTEILERARSRGHDFELLAKPLHPSELLAYLRQQ